ncbi:hypothetical protein IP88_13555 [alpha proteobacterium AAP81b]|nr:hypothetical protein IP88_13555 [alpha proteobacterium AAP81b]
MALECVRRDHTASLSPGDQRGPFLTARALGMALAAIHDAKALAEGRPPLLAAPASAGLVGLTGNAAIVAAAAAGSQLLLTRYPHQAGLLAAAWSQWLELHDLGAAGSAAEQAGRAFAMAVHFLGPNDAMAARSNAYAPSTPPRPYEHVAPPNQPGQGYAGGAWGSEAPPLLATRPAFPKPPGRVDATTVTPTLHYQADFAHVAAKGYDDRSHGRSAEEELIGIYWGYDGPPELGTPPRLYMQVVLTVLDDIEARGVNVLSVDDELAVIAGAGIAMADAGVHAWFYKYSPDHLMWRPVVGIQQALAPNGTADPTWLPLGRPDTNQPGVNPAMVRIPGTGLTPDFPAYPSGHATFGAAAFHLLRLFLVERRQAQFGTQGVDTVDFDFVSDEYNGRNIDPRNHQPRAVVTRRYPSLWRAIVENSLSRVFLGVHWQFDGLTRRSKDGTADEFDDRDIDLIRPDRLGQTGGVWLGCQIANQVAARLGVAPATIAAGKIV